MGDLDEILKTSKCKFSTQKVTYLGHVISKAGIYTDPAKIEIVTHNWEGDSNISWIYRLLSEVRERLRPSDREKANELKGFKSSPPV